MLTLIAARDRNGAIGKDGDIPWHAPEDLKAFQRETNGGAIVMGRHTWDSLPVKPLKNRMNIVVSRDGSLHEHVVASVDDALALAQGAGWMRVYGIGGAGIYEALLPKADRLLLTDVDLAVDGADTFFPEVDLTAWDEVGQVVLRDTEPACILREFLRK